MAWCCLCKYATNSLSCSCSRAVDEYSLHVGHFRGFGHSAEFPAPKFCYGEESQTSIGAVRFLIMQRLDADLPGYISSLVSRGVTVTQLSTVVSRLGTQLLTGMRAMHEKGFVFVDVKPANFMVTTTSSTDTDPRLFFIDFGLVERYTAATSGSAHRPDIPGGIPKGTPSFMSLAVQRGGVVARRDDLEAVVSLIHFTALYTVLQCTWCTSVDYFSL